MTTTETDHRNQAGAQPVSAPRPPGGMPTGHEGDNIQRWGPAIAGGALALYGLTRQSLPGAGLALAGGVLVYRGLAGSRLGERFLPGVLTQRTPTGISVERVVTINATPEALYAFWRRFENLPRFMRHVRMVTTIDEQRSHWVARAPAGTTVEWDAEILEDRPNELIRWRSLPGARVENAGSVRFVQGPPNRGTEVRVRLAYRPPAGALGAAAARLFGEEPDQQVREDLRRFKRLIETGEIATNDGQPRGTCRDG